MPNLTVSLTIPSSAVTRIVDATCIYFSYTGLDLNGQVETKNAFTKRMIIETIKNWVKTAENNSIVQSIHVNLQNTQIDNTSQIDNIPIT